MSDAASVEMHEFLLNADGELKDAMLNLPRVRDFIDDLPETASTFRLKQIDDIYQPNFEDVHLEFCKSWRLHDVYSPQSERVYVNPNHVHVHSYSDLAVECECGARFTRNYEDDHNSLRDEHSHSDDCLPHYRLESRAEMTRKRCQMMKRLGKLGWKGSDMAPRFGAQESMMGALADQFNTTLREVYGEYRRIAGNTYIHLVTEKGESSKDVAEVYGHARSTMTRWAQEYADLEYETEPGRNQHSGGR